MSDMLVQYNPTRTLRSQHKALLVQTAASTSYDLCAALCFHSVLLHWYRLLSARAPSAGGSEYCASEPRCAALVLCSSSLALLDMKNTFKSRLKTKLSINLCNKLI